MAHVFWYWVHNNPSRSSKVIDFGTSRKRARASYWSLIVTSVCRISETSEFLYAEFAESQFFRTPLLFRPNFEVFPLEYIRDVGSAQSEDPRLTNGEIIFEEFQPMWSRYFNVTDGRTDRRLAVRSNTALYVASRGKKVWQSHSKFFLQTLYEI